MMYISALLESSAVKVNSFSAEKLLVPHKNMVQLSLSLLSLIREWNECGQNKYPKPVTNPKVRPMPNLSSLGQLNGYLLFLLSQLFEWF